MAKQPVIMVDNYGQWHNWHRTLHVGGTSEKIFRPQNAYKTGPAPPGKEFIPGLKGLQIIVQDAVKNKKKVRAHGSGWSLNDIAFTDEYLVDSNQLNYVKVGVDPDQLTDTYKNKSQYLVFAQCGVMVQELNKHLEDHQLSLPTSGASDGQRIVGAIATGTHGSAHGVGAMTEYVRGIHNVIQGKHVFIQRASDEVVTSQFATWLDGAEIINDDGLFNAALVGFGGFGLTHALLLEVEPQYLLERVIKNYHIHEVRKAITEWDLSGLDLPYDVFPFHFECVLNPYPIPTNEKGAFVRVYYRHEMDPASVLDTGPPSDTPDLHTAIGVYFDEEKHTVIETKESIDGVQTRDAKSRAETIGFLMQIALHLSFPTETPQQPTRIPGKWFTGKNSANPVTNSPIPATSLELGIPFKRVGDAMDLVIEVANRHPFAAPLAFRYVKKSSATLGFTGLGDITATMEMPGPWGHIFFPRTGKAHEALFEALAASNIPHSFHWGQQFPKNTSWVRKTYGDAAVDDWILQREKLLGKEGVKIFSNKLYATIGLATTTPVGFWSKLKNIFRKIFSFLQKPKEDQENPVVT